MWAKCDKTRGNGFKLKEGEVEVRCGGDVLSPEAVPSAVGAPSLEVFKARTDEVLGNLI